MVSCALSSCISVDKILFILLSYIVQGCPKRMDMQSCAMLRSLLKEKKNARTKFENMYSRFLSFVTVV